MVLAEDGQKMSKSLKNYPDPSLIIDKYGADAMRHYMISSPLVQSEPLSFTEKGVDEVLKKIIQRYLNVVSFYELYKDSIFDKKPDFENFSEEKSPKESFERPDSENALDKWIVARLDETLKETTENLEEYKLDSASRPFYDFVDDLSTWYLRRSRDRVKGDDVEDKEQSLETLSYVIFEFAKTLAPFMPFLSEAIYQKMTGFNYKNADMSVHLLDWTKVQEPDNEIIKEMKIVRALVANSLEARDKAGIKVRQPLQKVFVGVDLNEQMKSIISDEINIKEVLFDPELNKNKVRLDTEISSELKQEGNMRELVRFIQNYRKDMNLKPVDKIKIQIKTDNRELIKKFAEYIQKITNATALDFSDVDEEGKGISIDNIKFVVKIER
jgi:isoleucyl-tRNA synthetase